MTVSNETHVRVAELQHEIVGFLGMAPQNVLFEFHKLADYVDLDLITVNSRHQQSFLFHSTEGRDKIEALENMLTYIKDNIDDELTYTIQWSMKGSKELNTSYFRAKNMVDAIDKLYYGRDRNSVSIFSCVLNPLT